MADWLCSGELMGRSIPTTLRAKVLGKYSDRCAKCGFTKKRALEIHHIHPVVLDGKTVLDNLIPLCHVCHRYAPEEQDLEDYLKEQYRVTDYYWLYGIFLGLVIREGMGKVDSERLKKVGVVSYFDTYLMPEAIKTLRTFRERGLE
jgi:HNH endonuclease